MCPSHTPSRQGRAALCGARLMGLGAAFRSKLELLVGTRSSLLLWGWKRAVEDAQDLNFPLQCLILRVTATLQLPLALVSVTKSCLHGHGAMQGKKRFPGSTDPKTCDSQQDGLA